MARVTTEDCTTSIPNRFQLVIYACNRARDLTSGTEPGVPVDNDKDTVVALREIAEETITKEQLTKVQETVNNINRYQLEIGNMTVKQHELMHSVASFRDELSLLQQEFEKEYGTFDVNIQTGKINYPENGEADKKD